jgi:hypothetical protein
MKFKNIIIKKINNKMIRNNNSIPKIIKALSLLVCVIIYTSASYAQSKDFNMSLTVVDASSSEDADGSILIKVDRNDDQYIYMLFNKEPWDGGKELARNESSGTEYSFIALKPGDYFVCIRNKDEITRCQNVTIKSNR